MTILYYTVGLYLLKVTQQFLVDNTPKNHHCFYGGSLKFEKEKLNISSSSITYYNSYKKYKSLLDKEIERKRDAIVVKVDIQNYYDNVSISKLLALILKKVKFSDLIANKFDKSSIELIEFFFKFLNDDRDCLPQGDNNVISSFIGYLYLKFGDFIIDDAVKQLVKSNPGFLKEYKIIRYVDDIHISFEFDTPTIKTAKYSADKANFVFEFLKIISDNFYTRLNLRFNSKTKIFDLSKSKELNKLITTVGSPSPDYPEPKSKKKVTVPDKVSDLLNTLEKIKALRLTDVVVGNFSFDINDLKDVYDENVRKYLQAPLISSRLESILLGFDYNLFRINIKSLVFILTFSPKAVHEFEAFLMKKNRLTTFDRDMIVNYLCQTNFKNPKLLNKLKEDDQLEDILKRIKEKRVINNKKPGYYKIEFKRLSKFKSEISLIEQIRMRVHYERINNFSVSLNLLLNEIHLICSLLESKDIKGYESSNVRMFLDSQGVNADEICKIAALFDRRNNNPLSHSGNDVRIASAVTREEYIDYKESVDTVLNHLLNLN